MSEEAETQGQETMDISKELEKQDMVDYLTSTGKISEKLAGSLYDEGLNSWKKLIEGTEEDFLAFKGVGPAKAKVLFEVAQEKQSELGASRPGLKEVLETVPRMSQRIISSLLENGYDSFESFKDKTEEDLSQIKGIGPKMSEAILKAVNEHVEKYGADEVEEATAEMVEEEASEEVQDERSLIQRIIDAIGGFFGGKKEEEEKTPEAPEEEQQKEEEAKEEAPEEEAAEEIVEEEPKVEEEPPEEPAAETKEEPVEEEAPPEEPQEEPVEEEAPAEEPTEEKEEVSEEEPKEEMGFLDKLKAMFFGGKKEEEPKEGAPAEAVEEAEGEEVKEEAPEEPAEEEPAEEPPAEEKAESEPEITDFEDIPGVSKKTADLLRNAGYLNIDELREAVPEDLVMIDGIGPKTAEKICKFVCK